MQTIKKNKYEINRESMENDLICAWFVVIEITFDIHPLNVGCAPIIVFPFLDCIACILFGRECINSIASGKIWQQETRYVQKI